MKHILVIEDDMDYRLTLKDALEKAGYEVIEAPDGKVGSRLYLQQPCDLVITDIFMPEKEGLETILELKEKFPNVKIIAISGGGGIWASSGEIIGPDEALKVAKDFGTDRILSKPFKIQHLLATMDELLKANLEEEL